MQTYSMLIGGEWLESESGDTIECRHAFDKQPTCRIQRGTPADAAKAAEAAYDALHSGPWGKMLPAERTALLRRFCDLYRQNIQSLIEIEVRDSSNLRSEMTFKVEYVLQVFQYYIGMIDKIEGSVPPVDIRDMFAYTVKEPIGPVVAIAPWNAPLLLMMTKVAPALAAGCTVIMKPSEFTSASTLECGKLFTEAGFPAGVVNIVTGYGSEVGEPLVVHPKTAKIAFTGGTATGKRISALAGEHLKPVTMELGGKSPNIVFDDADIDKVVEGAMRALFMQAGQVCIAGSRLLIHESIHDRFMEKMIARLKSAKVGDPNDINTVVGPIVTQAQFEKVAAYLELARQEGVSVAFGGEIVDAERSLVSPTIYTGVTNDMRIAREEIFGPVMSVIKFRTDDEAIAIANDTPYGLAAGVWTKSMPRAHKMAKAIQAGNVWINTYSMIYYSVPFGGYKQSGIGHENGLASIDSYLQTKSIWVNVAE